MSKKLKVAIAVGHRASSRGSYGNGGISEWSYNSRLGKEIVELVNNLEGVEAKLFFRQDRKGYSNNMRVQHKEIDAWGADIDIELHFNGSSNKRVAGHEVLYASKNGKKLASILNGMFNKYMPLHPNRGIKKRSSGRGSFGLKVGHSVSIIAEPYFASHQRDFMPNSLGWDKLISAYVDTIVTIFREGHFR